MAGRVGTLTPHGPHVGAPLLLGEPGLSVRIIVRACPSPARSQRWMQRCPPRGFWGLPIEARLIYEASGAPIPNICTKPFGVGWRLCASEQRVGAFEGCRSAHDHLGLVHSCSVPPSPRRGPVDGTDSAPTKSLQARQVGRRGVSDSLKLGLPQRRTT